MVTVPAGVLPGQQFRVRARSTAFELAAATWGSFTVSHSFTAHRMPTRLTTPHRSPPFAPPPHISLPNTRTIPLRTSGRRRRPGDDGHVPPALRPWRHRAHRRPRRGSAASHARTHTTGAANIEGDAGHRPRGRRRRAVLPRADRRGGGRHGGVPAKLRARIRPAHRGPHHPTHRRRRRSRGRRHGEKLCGGGEERREEEEGQGQGTGDRGRG